MSSYIPEYTFGLIPWPAHLRPSKIADASNSATDDQGGPLGVSESPALVSGPEAASDSPCGVELTKKGEAYAERALAEADGVFFLTLDSRDRTSIATTIDRLIDMLDAMEPDPDFEPDSDSEDGSDGEPSLGWAGVGCGTATLGPVCHNDDRELDNSDTEFNLGWERGSMPYDQTYIAMYGTDEAEEENEHGGDIQDEAHDPADCGDDEPFLGWGETCGQGPKIGCGLRHDPAVQCLDAAMDPTDTDIYSHSAGALGFDGEGYSIGNAMLRAVGHRGVRTAPGLPVADPDQLTIIRPGIAQIG